MMDDDDRDEAREALAQKVAHDDAWAWVLHHANGRHVVAQLLRAAGPFETSHVPGDPLSTAFREGQRSIGLAIYHAIMTAQPAAWARMDDLLRTGEEKS